VDLKRKRNDADAGTRGIAVVESADNAQALAGVDARRTALIFVTA
jgi:hypothetical protein